MRCDKCWDCKQITPEDFESLSYDMQRQLDCKTLTPLGQCDCYSLSHGSTSEVKA